MSPASRSARKTTSRAGAKSTRKKTAARKTAAAGNKARTRAPAKAPAKPAAPRRRRLSPKGRLAAVLEKLDKSFGVVALPEAESTLEKAVYLVLREGGTELTTARGMKALREDFVDWNEVRLSRPSELARLMANSTKASTQRRYVERASRIREMIDQIYNDRNDPCLEFILDERPKAQLEYLEDLDDLGIHNAYALVQWLAGDDKLVLVSAPFAKACQQLGITESGAVVKVRKSLSDMAEKTQFVRIQAHLNQLGHLEAKDWPHSLRELLD